MVLLHYLLAITIINGIVTLYAFSYIATISNITLSKAYFAEWTYPRERIVLAGSRSCHQAYSKKRVGDKFVRSRD